MNRYGGEIMPEYDRKSELQAFDNTKTGVKGLVDAGITKVPRIFIHEVQINEEHKVSSFSIPVIDFQGMENDDTSIQSAQRKETISSINNACKEWGFFEIINHGVPIDVMEKMIDGVRKFHDLDPELKKQYYSRDYSSRNIVYNSNYYLYEDPAADWRDTVYFTMTPTNPIDPKEFPDACRDTAIEYADQMNKLGCTIFRVLSEALGLDRNHLQIAMECVKRPKILGHYYPACPEPDRTLGIGVHSDTTFFTILLQDQVGGLQVLHQNQWVDVNPKPGSLLINIGDLLQMLTNDKYMSVKHRVTAKHVGPRISVGCFFAAAISLPSGKLLEPIKELLSEENPPKYRAVTVQEYLEFSRTIRREGKSPLLLLKL